MTVRILPEADADVIAAADWYESRQHGLGDRFIDRHQATLAQIDKHPDAWPLLYKSFRGTRIKRFPYRVVYCLWRGDMIVHAEMHFSLDPARLAERLSG